MSNHLYDMDLPNAISFAAYKARCVVRSIWTLTPEQQQDPAIKLAQELLVDVRLALEIAFKIQNKMIRELAELKRQIKANKSEGRLPLVGSYP